jgi:ribosomal protein S18 acetylase RimI-like enzyme
MQIRPWTSADTPGLRAMYRETWHATYGRTLSAPVLQALLALLDAPGLSAILPAADGRATVADAGGSAAAEIVGSIIVAERGRTAYIWAMYVAPGYQRQGLGRALLRQGTGWLSTAETLEVRVIRSSTGAMAFYEAFGFRETAIEDTNLGGGDGRDVLLLQTVVMTASRAEFNRRFQV